MEFIKWFIKSGFKQYWFHTIIGLIINIAFITNLDRILIENGGFLLSIVLPSLVLLAFDIAITMKIIDSFKKQKN